MEGLPQGYFFGGHGHVCWHHTTGEEYHGFDDYDELKAFFDSELERLQSEGAIRSAWINKDGEAAVFKWDLSLKILDLLWGFGPAERSDPITRPKNLIWVMTMTHECNDGGP